MDKDFIKLEDIYLQQPIPTDECSQHVFQQCAMLAHAYAINENAIVVMGENVSPGRSYCFYGGLADVLGIAPEERIAIYPSLYERFIFDRTNTDDLALRHAHELALIKLTQPMSPQERRNYYVSDYMRVRDKDGVWQWVNHRMFILAGTSDGSFWLNMCVYTLCNGQQAPQIVNTLTGKCRVLTDSDYHGILSSREIEVLQLINQGLLSKEIASMLFISINTVNRHKQNIFAKLNVDNAIEACRVARAMGLFA